MLILGLHVNLHMHDVMQLGHPLFNRVADLMPFHDRHAGIHLHDYIHQYMIAVYTGLQILDALHTWCPGNGAAQVQQLIFVKAVSEAVRGITENIPGCLDNQQADSDGSRRIDPRQSELRSYNPYCGPYAYNSIREIILSSSHQRMVINLLGQALVIYIYPHHRYGTHQRNTGRPELRRGLLPPNSERTASTIT